MKRTRRTETRIETHEIKIIRFGKRIDADDETLTDLELLPAPKLIGDEEKDLCPRKTRKDAKKKSLLFASFASFAGKFRRSS